MRREKGGKRLFLVGLNGGGEKIVFPRELPGPIEQHGLADTAQPDQNRAFAENPGTGAGQLNPHLAQDFIAPGQFHWLIARAWRERIMEGVCKV